ncbi:MAG TPA: Na+/H+ antiporter NhaA [Flavitalea sp.]|nr:Na+/H+ antiporter NhaA [Flavitalea sp.]
MKRPGKNIFSEFFESEKTGGIILIQCSVISLVLANLSFGHSYQHFWHQHADLSFASLNLNLSIEEWINDGLMTIFFLMVGLEIERELYKGELSNFRNAILPIAAAVGGMVVPASIHYLLNHNLSTVSGFGIPMATDIAFSLGILSLLGNRVPVSMKVFLTALAIIDDLGAIAVIGVFYTSDFSLTHFAVSIGIFALLMLLNKMGVKSMWFYLLPGIVMWYFMLQSGVHATITGVLLAFALPFTEKDEDNPSYKLQHLLHKPVSFIILPIFAIANTALTVSAESLKTLADPNSLGIALGLVFGKPAGIFLACYLLVKFKIACLPDSMNLKVIMGVGFLAGIGFTMSFFISNLAFENDQTVQASKMAILAATIIAGTAGYIMLRKLLPPREIQDKSSQ